MTRTRQAMEDAINGDLDKVDPAILRALRVIANATDDQDARWVSVQQRLTTLSLTVLGAVLSGLALMFFTR